MVKGSLEGTAVVEEQPCSVCGNHAICTWQGCDTWGKREIWAIGTGVRSSLRFGPSTSVPPDRSMFGSYLGAGPISSAGRLLGLLLKKTRGSFMNPLQQSLVRAGLQHCKTTTRKRQQRFVELELPIWSWSCGRVQRMRCTSCTTRVLKRVRFWCWSCRGRCTLRIYLPGLP